MEKSIDIYHRVRAVRHVKGFDYLGEPWFWARNRVWYKTEELMFCNLVQVVTGGESKRRDKAAWKIT